MKYIELFNQGDSPIQARKELNKKQLEVIAKHQQEIQKMYDSLEDKINNYEENMLKYERKLKNK